MIQHSDRLIDPMDPLTIRKSELTGMKAKTPEVFRSIMEIEIEGAAYFEDDIGVFLPGDNLRKSFIEGARLLKQGKSIERGLFVVEPRLKMKYSKADATLDQLKSDPHFRFARSVVQARNRIIRARPIFRDWSCEATVQYDPTIIKSDEQALKLFNTAGRYVGVGDWRMGKGGRYGSYEVSIVR